MVLGKKIMSGILSLVIVLIIAAYLAARILAPQFFGFWYYPINLEDPQWNTEKFDQSIWLNEKDRRAGMLADLEGRQDPLDRSELMELLGKRDGPYLGQDFYVPYSLGNFHRNDKNEKCSVVAKFEENSGYFSYFKLWCEPLRDRK